MLPGKKYGPADFIALGKRYWWIPAVTTVVCTFGALLYSASQKDIYRSDMLVQIIPQGLPPSLVQPTVTTKTEERIEGLKAQVTSRTTLERLINEYNLYPDERAVLPIEDVVNVMRGRVQTELIRQLRHLPAEGFKVQFTYENADVAAKVTAALGQLFIAENARERSTAADRASAFLQAQVAEAKERLEQQEVKVEAFRRANAGRLPTQAEHNMQAIQATQNTLQALLDSTARDRERRAMLETTYNDMMSLPVPTNPSTAAATAAVAQGEAALGASSRQQLQVAKAALERLEARLTNEHPDVRRQRRLVSDLEAKVAAEPATPATTVAAATGPVLTPEQIQRQEQLSLRRAEIQSLTLQIANKEQQAAKMQASIGAYQSRLEATPGVESEYIILTRDYNTLNTAYQDRLRKAEDSKVAAELERQNVGESFKIVDPARVPTNAIGPQRLQTNLLGFGAGLVLGIGIVALIFVMDTTFRSEADVLDVLALPVLAIVPYVVDAAEKRRRYVRKLAIAGVVGVAACVGGYVTWSMELWRFVS